MKKAYAEALDASLRVEIPKCISGFNLVAPRRPRGGQSNLGKSDLVFSKDVGDISFYLVFSRHPRQEEFNLELAWSIDHAYPIELERPSVSISKDGSEMRLKEAIIGFYDLYPKVTGRSHLGWAVWRCSVDFDHPQFRQIFVLEDMAPVSDEDARFGVASAVKKCIDDIKQVALPYLDAVRCVHLQR